MLVLLKALKHEQKESFGFFYTNILYLFLFLPYSPLRWNESLKIVKPFGSVRGYGYVFLIGVKYKYLGVHQRLRSLKEPQAMQTNPDSPIRVNLVEQTHVQGIKT